MSMYLRTLLFYQTIWKDNSIQVDSDEYFNYVIGQFFTFDFPCIWHCITFQDTKLNSGERR